MNLQRELWRYECGLASRVLLETLLTNEVNRVVTLFRQEETRWWKIAQPGRKEFALRAFFGQQVDAAREDILQGKLRSSWKHIQDADRTLRKLLVAVKAEDHIKAAEDLLQSLPTDIAGARTSVATITEAAKRLLTRAQEEQLQGNFHVADHMARLAREQVENAPSSDLTERLGSIGNADASLLARFPAVPAHMMFAEALNIAARLIVQQQLGLAVHFCDDLEQEARARTAFLRELESQGDAMRHPGGLEAALVQLGRPPGESWQSTLHRLLHSQFERVAESIRTINTTRAVAGAPMEVGAHESP
jgi:hypothetical protein